MFVRIDDPTHRELGVMTSLNEYLIESAKPLAVCTSEVRVARQPACPLFQIARSTKPFFSCLSVCIGRGNMMVQSTIVSIYRHIHGVRSCRLPIQLGYMHGSFLRYHPQQERGSS